MLRSRLIPFLLVEGSSLVKTVAFREPKYLGDPLNAVRIFNEMEVDELFIADRAATTKNIGPDLSRLEEFAKQCRMPVTYAGGIDSPQQVEQLIDLGIEKVGIGSAFLSDPEIVSQAVARVGAQSVSVIIDYRDDGLVYSGNGSTCSSQDVSKVALLAESLGAGEIVLNSIDGDGTYRGLDVATLSNLRELLGTPVTIAGGARSLDDIAFVARTFWPLGIAVGSLFTLTGKFRSPLMSYPNGSEKKALMASQNGGEG